jgi:NitT/TauT family transport system substrate-binding protein
MLKKIFMTLLAPVSSSLLTSLLFALSVSSVLAASGTSGSAVVPVTAVKLGLNWKPEPEFGGFYEAQEATIFEKAGLKVEIIPGGSGQPVIQMVAAQKIEFGIASADEVIISRSKGADVVALFAVYQTNPQGIMVHASKKLKDMAEVFSSGLTLAIQKGLPYSNFLEKKYGFTKVKIVPYSGGLTNFLHDPNFAQQCFITSEPIAAKREKSDPQTFLIADSGYNPYTAVLVTNGKYAQKNPQVVKKMVESVREGWKRYLKDPKATNVVMQKLNPGMDIETFNESARIQKPLIETNETKKSGLGSMTQKRWEELNQQLVDLKVIEKPIKVPGTFM